MATVKARPEVSKKNKYYISRHRYYELKHFCFQYKEWHSKLNGVNYFFKQPLSEMRNANGGHSDPTCTCAIMQQYYMDRIALVEQAAHDADPDLAKYILVGVTDGIPYDCLKARYNEMPCSRDVYYEAYRRFFWLLSKRRQ